MPSSTNADGMSVNGAAEGSEGGASSDAATHGSGGPGDPMALQMHLANLATLVRKALRSVQGEEPEHSDSEDEDGSSSSSSSSAGASDVGSGARITQHNNIGALTAQFDLERLRQLGRPQSVASSAVRTRTSGRTVISSGARRKRANSKQERCEGGYLRLLSDNGDADIANAALERDTEIERLNKENSALREMLGIAGNLPPDPTAEQINPPSILQNPTTTSSLYSSQGSSSGVLPKRNVSATSSSNDNVISNIQLNVGKPQNKPVNLRLRNPLASGSAIDDDDDDDDEEDDDDSDDDGHTYLEDISLARQQQAASPAPTTPEILQSPPKSESPPKSSTSIAIPQQPVELAESGDGQVTTPVSVPRSSPASPPPRTAIPQPKSPVKPIVSPPRAPVSALSKAVMSPPRAATPALPQTSTAASSHASPKVARTGLTTTASTALPATVSTTNATGKAFAASGANATTGTE